MIKDFRPPVHPITRLPPPTHWLARLIVLPLPATCRPAHNLPTESPLHVIHLHHHPTVPHLRPIRPLAPAIRPRVPAIHPPVHLTVLRRQVIPRRRQITHLLRLSILQVHHGTPRRAPLIVRLRRLTHRRARTTLRPARPIVQHRPVILLLHRLIRRHRRTIPQHHLSTPRVRRVTRHQALKLVTITIGSNILEKQMNKILL